MTRALQDITRDYRALAEDCIWFPAPIPGSSKLSITPAPWHPTPSFGLFFQGIMLIALCLQPYLALDVWIWTPVFKLGSKCFSHWIFHAALSLLYRRAKYSRDRSNIVRVTWPLSDEKGLHSAPSFVEENRGVIIELHYIPCTSYYLNFGWDQIFVCYWVKNKILIVWKEVTYKIISEVAIHWKKYVIISENK